MRKQMMERTKMIKRKNQKYLKREKIKVSLTKISEELRSISLAKMVRFVKVSSMSKTDIFKEAQGDQVFALTEKFTKMIRLRKVKFS